MDAVPKRPNPLFGMHMVTTKTKVVYSNPLEAVKKIYSKNGILGLGRLGLSTLCSIVIVLRANLGLGSGLGLSTLCIVI